MRIEYVVSFGKDGPKVTHRVVTGAGDDDGTGESGHGSDGGDGESGHGSDGGDGESGHGSDGGDGESGHGSDGGDGGLGCEGSVIVLGPTIVTGSAVQPARPVALH